MSAAGKITYGRARDQEEEGRQRFLDSDTREDRAGCQPSYATNIPTGRHRPYTQRLGYRMKDPSYVGASIVVSGKDVGYSQRQCTIESRAGMSVHNLASC